MRFLLLLALFLHAGPAEGTQLEDEMGTPNINSIIEWVRSEYPDLPRIQTTNCRKIAGSSTWSQHSWANAADIFVTKAQGNELYPRLKEKFGAHIKTILWQVRDHYDHIHVDTWPTGTGTPPCAGGSLKVKHKDGTIGSAFTDDIRIGDDDDVVLKQILKGQTTAFYREMQARTGVPVGDAAYWGSDDPRRPAESEWDAALDDFVGAIFQMAVWPPAPPNAPNTGLTEAQVRSLAAAEIAKRITNG